MWLSVSSDASNGNGSGVLVWSAGNSSSSVTASLNALYCFYVSFYGGSAASGNGSVVNGSSVNVTSAVGGGFVLNYSATPGA
jgi:hypothetical protein